MIIANKKPATEKDYFIQQWLRCTHLEKSQLFFFNCTFPFLLQRKPGGFVLGEPLASCVFTFKCKSLCLPSPAPPWRSGDERRTALPLHSTPLFIVAADTSCIALQDPSKQMAGVHGPQAALYNSTQSQGEKARPSPVLFLSDRTDLDFYSFPSCLLVGMKASRCRESCLASAMLHSYPKHQIPEVTLHQPAHESASKGEGP